MQKEAKRPIVTSQLSIDSGRMNTYACPPFQIFYLQRNNVWKLCDLVLRLLHNVLVKYAEVCDFVTKTKYCCLRFTISGCLVLVFEKKDYLKEIHVSSSRFVRYSSCCYSVSWSCDWSLLSASSAEVLVFRAGCCVRCLTSDCREESWKRVMWLRTHWKHRGVDSCLNHLIICEPNHHLHLWGLNGTLWSVAAISDFEVKTGP